MKIVLVRHAESNANVEGIVDSQLPGTALTPRGICAATRTVSHMRELVEAGIARCYCSPFLRALQTVEYLRLGVPIVVDHRLKELDYGRYQGRRSAEISAEVHEFFRWGDPRQSSNVKMGSDGETYAELAARVGSFLSEIFSRGEEVIVVSHESVLLEIMKAAGVPDLILGRSDRQSAEVLQFRCIDIRVHDTLE